MIRAELERYLVARSNQRSGQPPDTLVTIDVLLDILETTRVLEAPRADPICPRCNKMRSGWPDDWHWDGHRYVCGECKERT